MLNRAFSLNHSVAFRLISLSALLLCVSVKAELPQAHLTHISPAGAARGTTAEVTLAGEDLDGVTNLYFSSPRISAKPKTNEKGEAVSNKFLVTVEPEATPGLYDIRAIGRYGISNPRTLQVGDGPEVVGKPGNTSMPTAVDLPERFAVDSIAEANAAHYYRMAVHKGQRIHVAVSTSCIESKMEAILLLSDPGGHEVARSRSGEPLDYTSATDGTHVLKVHDVLYRGGPDYFYRLTSASTDPATRLMPPADFSLFRWPVPPAAALLEAASCRSTRGESNTRFLYLPQSNVITDTSDADPKADPAPLLDAPCIVVGRFSGRDQSASYSFNASAGSIYWLEAISHRLGEAASPMLLIQRMDKDGKGVLTAVDIQDVYESPAGGLPEFSASSRDPAYRLECKQAGTYRVMIRNLFGSSSNKGAEYCLEIRHESPDFHLVAVPSSPLPDPKDSKDIPLSTTFLRRGGVTPIRVVAQRRDGFNGEIRLQVRGLPAGVTALSGVIPAGDSVGTLLLGATGDAGEAVAAISVSGIVQIRGVEVTREARAGTVSWSLYDKGNKRIDMARSRLTAELMIGVSGSEESPLSIRPATEQVWEAKEGGKLSIPIKLGRKGEMVGPISLRLAGHSLLATSKEITLDPKADGGNIDLDLAQNKLPPGEYMLHIEAQGKVKYTRKVGDKPQVADITASFYSTPFRVRVVAAPKPAK
jgi:hypothetical protein